MAILIQNILDVHSTESINEILSDKQAFKDGRKSAGKTARAVKQNLQADSNSVLIKGASKLIEEKLNAHPVFKHAAYPDKFAKIMFSRYETGMGYGDHIDDAMISGVRTDMAFTLFLSGPESYQGGELIISKHDGEDSIKLEAGAMYLYPADTIHRVMPVRSGVRLAAVGWVQSKIRLTQHRDILFDLFTTLKTLSQSEENRIARLSLLKIQSNLQRLWIE